MKLRFLRIFCDISIYIYILISCPYLKLEKKKKPLESCIHLVTVLIYLAFYYFLFSRNDLNWMQSLENKRTTQLHLLFLFFFLSNFENINKSNNYLFIFPYTYLINTEQIN